MTTQLNSNFSFKLYLVIVKHKWGYVSTLPSPTQYSRHRCKPPFSACTDILLQGTALALKRKAILRMYQLCEPMRGFVNS